MIPRLPCVLLFVPLGLALAATPAPAQEPAPPPPATPAIDRVEEDWELVITEPSPAEEGPQITTTMTIQRDPSRAFVVFNLNYRDSPFRPGGMQVQSWYGDELVHAGESREAQLATPNETIKWTQRLTSLSGWLVFEIVNGESTTWGNFGGASLRTYAFAEGLTLSQYSPEASIAQSGVSWQSNRVTRMTLVKVRKYAGSQLLSEDTQPREALVKPAE
jgi:hypothetical protein